MNASPANDIIPSDPESIRAAVREGYGKIATAQSQSCCGPTCCNGGAAGDADQLASAVGYAADDLQALPEGANLGLSCGNPIALASLQPGETVIDLGSGGGFDVFIAGRKVGPAGRAIGVDMTPEMLARARRNLAAYRQAGNPDNVEFRLGEIEHLPLADASADIVISNCVINLSPDKPQVWREIARVLKPGGRVSVSDIALRRPLPAAVQSMVEALVGCIAGAVLIEETRHMAHSAGLVDVLLEEKTQAIEALVDSHDPLYQKILQALPPDSHITDYVVSLAVTARKP